MQPFCVKCCTKLQMKGARAVTVKSRSPVAQPEWNVTGGSCHDKEYVANADNSNILEMQQACHCCVSFVI